MKFNKMEETQNKKTVQEQSNEIASSSGMPTEPVKKVEQKTTSKSSGKIAIVLIRGMVNLSGEVKDTLSKLNLHRKNNCVVIVDNPVNRGMIKRVKDYITWGIISEKMFLELVEQRGELYKGRTSDLKNKYTYKTLDVSGKKYKTYFRLNPPRKGFGRKGIKMPFKLGGALGDRAEKINDLLERMI